jgi:hypothetical protein
MQTCSTNKEFDMINDFWLRPLYFALGFAVCFALVANGVI